MTYVYGNKNNGRIKMIEATNRSQADRLFAERLSNGYVMEDGIRKFDNPNDYEFKFKL